MEYPKKFVVFCHHKAVMQGLEDHLYKYQQKSKSNSKNDPIYVKIDGSTSGTGRERAVKTF
jgi:hypothetical protein